MDELTPTAKAIGAVNVIYLKENKLIGNNTDASGFLADLKRFLTLESDSLLSEVQREALILGAGGSARAVVYALLKDGWKVSLAARRIEQANELARSFSDHKIQVVNGQQFLIPHSSFDLLINTTPIGMSPNIDQSPWPQEIPFPKAAVIYDLVYNPRETRLVREARSQGLNATTGLGMLIEQAALAFELWTGKIPPREILFESLNH
jgi:shikimate dehydrogenase